MAKKTYPEKLDESIFDAILRVRGTVLDTYPDDSLINSLMRASYVAMPPQEQLQVLDNLGPDWMVEVGSKIEKKLAEIDKQGTR